jgi:hypothetical protein
VNRFDFYEESEWVGALSKEVSVKEPVYLSTGVCVAFDISKEKNLSKIRKWDSVRP